MESVYCAVYRSPYITQIGFVLKELIFIIFCVSTKGCVMSLFFIRHLLLYAAGAFKVRKTKHDIHTNVLKYVTTYLPTYLPTYIYTYIHIYTCIHSYTYINTHTYIIHIYTHIYIHAYIHTYIHTHT